MGKKAITTIKQLIYMFLSRKLTILLWLMLAIHGQTLITSVPYENITSHSQPKNSKAHGLFNRILAAYAGDVSIGHSAISGTRHARPDIASSKNLKVGLFSSLLRNLKKSNESTSDVSEVRQ